MKTLITILLLAVAPLASFAQNDADALSNETETVISATDESSIEKKVEVSTASKSSSQIKAIKINHNKSHELISIKAYRKSLQIKMKTIKMC